MFRRLPLVVLVLAALYACIDPPAPPSTAAAPSPGSQLHGLPRYDAELIYADFAAQDAEAIEKYRRAPFVVTGRLQKIHATGTRELQLDLKASDPAHPVRAWLKSDLACDGGHRCPEQVALDMLPRGFKVYLECSRADLEGGTPTVAGCVLTGGPGRLH